MRLKFERERTEKSGKDFQREVRNSAMFLRARYGKFGTGLGEKSGMGLGAGWY